MPQAPQFCGSLCSLTQEVPHFVAPPLHVSAHAPAVQTWPAAHTLPQAPQLSKSVCVSTHDWPHTALEPEQVSTLLASVVGVVDDVVLPQPGTPTSTAETRREAPRPNDLNKVPIGPTCR